MAITNFALNFSEDVQWAMCLRLKPDAITAIIENAHTARIKFAEDGQKHVIEVGDKKFVLDCRQTPEGTTVCQAHNNWSAGRMTEVAVAGLRGDIQTTFAEKQQMANAKTCHSDTALHQRIKAASCPRLSTEKRMPSDAGKCNRNTVITSIPSLLRARSRKSPPVQPQAVTEKREVRASPVKRCTPPQLMESNGEVVSKELLEEVARNAASKGKLRVCVMALLGMGNFRVQKKLCRKVISYFEETKQNTTVPGENSVEIVLKEFSTWSSGCLTLTEKARGDFLKILPEFRSTKAGLPVSAPHSPVGNAPKSTHPPSSEAVAPAMGSKGKHRDPNPKHDTKLAKSKHGRQKGSKRRDNDVQDGGPTKKHKNADIGQKLSEKDSAPRQGKNGSKLPLKGNATEGVLKRGYEAHESRTDHRTEKKAKKEKYALTEKESNRLDKSSGEPLEKSKSKQNGAQVGASALHDDQSKDGLAIKASNDCKRGVAAQPVDKAPGGCTMANAEPENAPAAAFPPKVVAAAELLEEVDCPAPAWLESADDGAVDLDDTERVVDPSEKVKGCIGADTGLLNNAEGREALVDGFRIDPVTQGSKAKDQKTVHRLDKEQVNDDDDDFSLGGTQGIAQMDRTDVDRHADAEQRVESRNYDSERSQVHNGEGKDAADVGKLVPVDGKHLPLPHSMNGRNDIQEYHSEMRLSKEKLQGYLEMTLSQHEVCLNQEQLVKDYKVYRWLVSEVETKMQALQAIRADESLTAQQMETLREFETNYEQWCSKSKLMSLLFNKLQKSRSALTQQVGR